MLLNFVESIVYLYINVNIYLKECFNDYIYPYINIFNKINDVYIIKDNTIFKLDNYSPQYNSTSEDNNTSEDNSISQDNNISHDNIIHKIEDNLYFYTNKQLFNKKLFKKIHLALITITVKINDKSIVTSLEITNFINNIYKHNDIKELDFDNRLWLQIFKRFLNNNEINICDILEDSDISIKYSIIDMNGDYNNSNYLKI
jgi:hypothetical protein